MFEVTALEESEVVEVKTTSSSEEPAALVPEAAHPLGADSGFFSTCPRLKSRDPLDQLPS